MIRHKVKMLKSTYANDFDGKQRYYRKGGVYEIGDRLFHIFKDGGYVALVKEPRAKSENNEKLKSKTE